MEYNGIGHFSLSNHAWNNVTTFHWHWSNVLTYWHISGEETIIENEDGTEEGWVETHHFDSSANEIEDKVRDMTLDGNKNDDEFAGDMEDEMDRVGGGGEDDDEEAADMEDFEESGMLDAVDPVRFTNM